MAPKRKAAEDHQGTESGRKPKSAAALLGRGPRLAVRTMRGRAPRRHAAVVPNLRSICEPLDCARDEFAEEALALERLEERRGEAQAPCPFGPCACTTRPRMREGASLHGCSLESSGLCFIVGCNDVGAAEASGLRQIRRRSHIGMNAKSTRQRGGAGLLDAGMRFRCCSSAARCKSRTTSLREVHSGVSIDAGGEGLRALGGDGAKLIRKLLIVVRRSR